MCRKSAGRRRAFKQDAAWFYAYDALGTPTGAELAITVMHHSPDWYNDEQKNMIEATLHEKCSIVFYGHEHYISCKRIENEDSDPILN